jgi:elongation factor 1-gamma
MTCERADSRVTGATADLGPVISGWFRPLLGLAPYNKKAVEEAEKATHGVFQTFEKIIASRTFLVGERVTVADIAVTAFFQRGAETVRTLASPAMKGSS